MLFFIPLTLYIQGHSQPPTKRIDSIVKMIEAQKNLKLNTVCDTLSISYSDLSTIECLKFYFAKDKLHKVIYSTDFHHKDSTRKNIPTRFDVFYYDDELLIKVISKDFDQSPPKDLRYYLNEKDLKKYLAKETLNASKYDGADYFIELGYILLDEFKILMKK